MTGSLRTRILVDVAFGNLGEEPVGVLFFLEIRFEKIDGVVHPELLAPRDQRAVARDLVMLHGLGSRQDSGVADFLVGDLGGEPVGLLDDAFDGIATLALSRHVAHLEHLLEAL